jgi:hypothetical protein
LSNAKSRLLTRPNTTTPRVSPAREGQPPDPEGPRRFGHLKPSAISRVSVQGDAFQAPASSREPRVNRPQKRNCQYTYNIDSFTTAAPRQKAASDDAALSTPIRQAAQARDAHARLHAPLPRGAKKATRVGGPGRPPEKAASPKTSSAWEPTFTPEAAVPPGDVPPTLVNQ